jgi:hypothetical protein
MALAKTVNEAVTQMLRRVGKDSSTTWKAIALEHLNDALEFIGGQHDWKFLRKVSTITTSDATGIIALPSDCDRVLSLYESGSGRLLQLVDAFNFSNEKEAAAVTWPQFYQVYDSTQDTTTQPPHYRIEIFTAPSASTTFQISYVKRLDELTASDTVPNIEPRIWNTIQAKALMDVLLTAEQPKETIAIAERHFVASLESCKRAEKYGSTKYDSIRLNGALSNHLKRRFTENA